jgi:hypothetical protein
LFYLLNIFNELFAIAGLYSFYLNSPFPVSLLRSALKAIFSIHDRLNYSPFLLRFFVRRKRGGKVKKLFLSSKSFFQLFSFYFFDHRSLDPPPLLAFLNPLLHGNLRSFSLPNSFSELVFVLAAAKVNFIF